MMTTDEQRMRFEVFLASWFDEYDRAMLAPEELTNLKAAYEAGHLSRDAEVQALKEALGSIVHASNNWAMPIQAFDVTWKLADIARAALAGGEDRTEDNS